jgi:hypothetical protein
MKRGARSFDRAPGTGASPDAAASVTINAANPFSGSPVFYWDGDIPPSYLALLPATSVSSAP